MLYSGDNPILRIEGVEHMHWSEGVFSVAPRAYSALAFRVKGTASILCNGAEYYVNANDVLYLPQNTGYTAHYTDTELLVVHFVTARSDSEVEVYALENSEEIYKMFLRIRSIWESKEPGYSVYAMSRLYAILGTIFESETKDNLPEHFLRAISYINTNYRSNITVSGICAHAGISATAFRQLFRQHYRKAPVEYITNLRLEYARNLISGGMAIETAALESGFSDPKYFARVVKKYFGCTPRALKNYGK